MDTLSITVRYRPIRIGWCVSSDDFIAYREALQLSHTMWGGRYNPIIPVDNLDLAQALVELFRVDLLWPVSKSKQVESFIKRFPYLPNPFFHDQLFVTYSKDRKNASILDIRHPVHKLYDDYFKNQLNPGAKVSMYEWDQKDPLSDILLATFGELPSEQITGIKYLSLIEQCFAPEKIKINAEEPWPVVDNEHLTLSGLGQYGIKQHYSIKNSFDHEGFYLGNVDDFDDLINFWNLRATDIKLVFFDPRYSNRLSNIREKWLDVLNKTPEEYLKHKNKVGVWHKNRDSEFDLSIFGANLTINTIDDAIWNGLNLNVPYMYFSEGRTLANIGRNGNKPSISFPLPPKPFSEEQCLFDQHFVISTDFGVGLLGDERVTLTIPYIPSLNEIYGRECYFEWNKTRVEHSALGVISNPRISDLNFSAIDINRLFQLIFQEAGITIKPSKPGLIASSIIQQMGGLKNCRPFKIAGVRDLIKKYSPDQSFTRSGAVEIIRAIDSNTKKPGFTVYENLYIEARRIGSKLTPDAVIAYLLNRNIFRSGLELYCPSCQLDFWTHLDELRTETTCMYCGNKFNITPYLRDRGDWRFRRTGLFGRDNNQEGSIPVILLLQQLDTLFGNNKLLYTTAMELSSKHYKKGCETDFIAILPKHNRVEIAIGECKTKDSIDEDDIIKLKLAADMLKEKQFCVYIVLAKLTSFTPEEIKIAETLNEPHLHRVILLTERELEPYFLYERTSKELGIKAPGCFEDLAITTQQIYFSTKI